jgi:hypothetical protein
MKIKYRKPSLIEKMKEALSDKSKYIECFELTQDEFTRHYSSFDRSVDSNGESVYTYSGILIKVDQ